jgi:anti-anti-sigma factor
MGSDFAIEVDHDAAARVCVVALAGKLDPLAVEQVDPVVEQLFGDGHRAFVLDLGRLTYVGSVGLRVLIGLANRVRADGYLGVCNVAPPVRHLLDLTKASTLLRIFPTRADAIDAARSR